MGNNLSIRIFHFPQFKGWYVRQGNYSAFIKTYSDLRLGGRLRHNEVLTCSPSRCFLGLCHVSKICKINGLLKLISNEFEQIARSFFECFINRTNKGINNCEETEKRRFVTSHQVHYVDHNLQNGWLTQWYLWFKDQNKQLLKQKTLIKCFDYKEYMEIEGLWIWNFKFNPWTLNR